MALMRYYAQYNNSGKLLAIGTGPGGTEITEAEYNEIKSVIGNMPQAESGYWYRLTDSLVGEKYEIITPAPEPTPEERIAALEQELAAAKILLGLE